LPTIVPGPVAIGFGITHHCNLRCPHCIRDDVVGVKELDPDFMLRVLGEARDLFGSVTASFTGGEPMLHSRWSELIDGLRSARIPYTFVSNGWHTGSLAGLLDRYPPYLVRLSLSGANADVHDAERGGGSFGRVLLSTAILTNRCVPAVYSFLIDRRTRSQLAEAYDLAARMGCVAIRYIFPQPVPATMARDSDLPPQEWREARLELAELAANAGATRLIVDYGAPFIDEPFLCDTMSYKRIYIDVDGRMCTCCQLSEYGANAEEVVADLHQLSFRDAFARYVARIEALKVISAPQGANDPLASMPCLRCARAAGKLQWLRAFPGTDWAVAGKREDEPTTVVPLHYSRKAKRIVVS
jgi:MoaA/NifB/PqqE/SkfB family radical SAM enzyme